VIYWHQFINEYLTDLMNNPFMSLLVTYPQSVFCGQLGSVYLGEINVPRRCASFSDRSVRHGQDCRWVTICKETFVEGLSDLNAHPDFAHCIDLWWQ